MRILRALIVLLTLLLMSGCSTRNTDASRNKNINASPTRDSIVHSVELIDQQGLDKIIRERKGKPLLLNIWATWCQPCVEEFPELIKLAASDTLVDVIGISVDYPDELDTKVLPFLVKLKVPFKIYIAKFNKQEDFIAAIDSTWNGAVPATYIYNGNGRKKFSFIGQGTFEQFEKNIRMVMKEG